MKAYLPGTSATIWIGMLPFVVAIGMSVSPAYANDWPNEQVYGKAMNYVVWIRTNHNSGSGTFLSGEIYRSQRVGIVATNAHVVKDEERVEVFFPVFSTEDNAWKTDRAWYLKNARTLSHRGYFTIGQVILKSEEFDIAIVEIFNFPGEPRTINLDPNRTCDQFVRGEPMHILGNPVGRELWRWAGGHFVECAPSKKISVWDVDTEVLIAATGAGGHSGGPVFDKTGAFVGIHRASNKDTRAWTVTAEAIEFGLNFSFPLEVFVIRNELNRSVPYSLSYRDEHLAGSPEDDELHRNTGTLPARSRSGFLFVYSSDILMEIGTTGVPVSYSLNAVPNRSLPIVFFRETNPNRKFMVREYQVRKRGSGLQMVDAGVRRYSLNQTDIKFRMFRHGDSDVIDGVSP